MAKKNTIPTQAQAQAIMQAQAAQAAAQALMQYASTMLAFANADAHELHEECADAQAIAKAQAQVVRNALASAGIGAPVARAIASTSDGRVAPAPKQSQVVAPAGNVVCMFVRDGAFITSATADGTYIGRASVRHILNARIRAAGGKWDKAHKAYKFASATAAAEFVRTADAIVTPAQWDEYMGTMERKAKEREARA